MYDLEKLNDLGVLQYGAPALHIPSQLITAFDPQLEALIERMFRVMYDAPGVGLSAVQIGVLQRVFVADTGYRADMKLPKVYINPSIVERSDELIASEEGCLSFANVYMPVPRHKEILVRYQNELGSAVEERLSDFNAIVFQHELDHLDGLTFMDRVSRLRRETAMRKASKSRRLSA